MHSYSPLKCSQYYVIINNLLLNRKDRYERL
ncbi:hypothetical protein VP249E411_P0118 [Vibrio phage 249E41-1]|nr:hypothetical protein VP249E411_P0118 [Vibrio phage 249E41-1]